MSTRQLVMKLCDEEFETLLRGEPMKIADIQVIGLMERSIHVLIEKDILERCIKKWIQKNE